MSHRRLVMQFVLSVNSAAEVACVQVLRDMEDVLYWLEYYYIVRWDMSVSITQIVYILSAIDKIAKKFIFCTNCYLQISSALEFPPDNFNDNFVFYICSLRNLINRECWIMVEMYIFIWFEKFVSVHAFWAQNIKMTMLTLIFSFTNFNCFDQATQELYGKLYNK